MGLIYLRAYLKCKLDSFTIVAAGYVRSAAGERQLERGHLLAVADQQHVAD